MKPEPRGSGYNAGSFESPMTHLHRRLAMDKSIGFYIDHKNTVACMTQAGRRTRNARKKTRTVCNKLIPCLSCVMGEG